MHGGAKGSGAPNGNKNALKTGAYTRDAIAERRRARRAIRMAKNIITKYIRER